MSKIAGVDLVPVMDYEIGHVNMSIPGNRAMHDDKVMISEEDEEAIVGWHRDSYPFVCVLMMSDTTGMVGGETALRMGNGEIRKVRGPSMVCTSYIFCRRVGLTFDRGVPLSYRAGTSITRLYELLVARSVSLWSRLSDHAALVYVMIQCKPSQ